MPRDPRDIGPILFPLLAVFVCVALGALGGCTIGLVGGIYLKPDGLGWASNGFIIGLIAGLVIGLVVSIRMIRGGNNP